MVFIKNAIFVLGGYNPPLNMFLKSCEKYDIESDKWTKVSDMKY